MGIFGKSKKDFFNKENMALLYDSFSFAYHYFPKIIQLVDITQGEKILDVGCGPALCLDREKYGFTYIGVDLSENMLKMAKKRNGVFVRADAEYLPFIPNVFDGVISFNLLQYTDSEKSVEEMIKVLKPERKIVATTNPKAAEKAENVLRKYDFQDVQNIRPKVSMIDTLKFSFKLSKFTYEKLKDMNFEYIKSKEEFVEIAMKTMRETSVEVISPISLPYVLGKKPL